MTHVEEHTLELFVLNAKEVRSRRKAIEAHLKKCEGCRTLARTMAEYYANAEAQIKSEAQAHPHSEALTRPRGGIVPLDEPYYSMIKMPASPRTPRTFLQHAYSYARQNPIKSTAGSIAIVVGLILIFNSTLTTAFRDTNPAYTIMSAARDAIEVYNKEDEMLWQLPIQHAEAFIESEKTRGIRYTYVSDLIGDGRNEVITSVPLPSDMNIAKTLRVYSGNKSILFQKRIEDDKVKFMSNRYDADFVFKDLLVDNFGEGTGKEIFVSTNNARSPWFLVRLNANGHTIGRFWHFGQMMSANEIPMSDSTKKAILLCGVNQANELQGDQLSVIEVLDPLKIVGDAEATATRGFGFAPSNAELYYIRIPVSDMNKPLGANQGAPSFVSSENETQYRFSVNSGAANREPGFEYIFSKDWRILEVKYDSQDILLHAKLKKEGKVSSTFNQNYLEGLRRGVEYWDGTKWTKERTKVFHANTPSP